MVKVKFHGNAPSGFEGYGKEVYEIGEKGLEKYQKAGIYNIEIIEEAKKSTKKSKPSK